VSSATTTCTITGGSQDLRTNNFAISVTPRSAIPAGITYQVDFPSTTAIIIRWSNVTGANVSTGAITFNWTAVR